jgi:hypothetical protein
MFFVLKIELILIIDSNNVLTEGAALDRAALRCQELVAFMTSLQNVFYHQWVLQVMSPSACCFIAYVYIYVYIHMFKDSAESLNI